jgi:hypothetical protein
MRLSPAIIAGRCVVVSCSLLQRSSPTAQNADRRASLRFHSGARNFSTRRRIQRVHRARNRKYQRA